MSFSYFVPDFIAPTTFTGTGSALNDLLYSDDSTGYPICFVQLSCADGGSATVLVNFECSNTGGSDPSEWTAVACQFVAGETFQEVTQLNYEIVGSGSVSPAMLKIRLFGRYFRIRLSYYTGSGATIQADGYFSDHDIADATPVVYAQLTDFTGNMPTIGSDVSADSLCVNIATDQVPVPTVSPSLDLRLDDTSTAHVTYVGKAAIGSATSSNVWQVQKIDETTGMVIQWAGTGVFDQIWDNRTSLIYN